MSTVLIVDDDPQTLGVLRIAFTAGGYQVVTEAVGRAVLRAASQVTPQVILLSIELSDMDGWEVLVALRDLTSAPIIVLSTRHDAEEAVRALDTGADDYVASPSVSRNSSPGPVLRSGVRPPGLVNAAGSSTPGPSPWSSTRGRCGVREPRSA